ncbi:MAG: sugar ABC transporter permease [Planctomycetota bacterium]
MLAPFACLLGAWVVWPLLGSAASGLRPTLIGQLATDRIFWGALANTALITAALLVIQLPLGLGLALLLDRRDVFGRGFLRLAYFSTHLVGAVFAAVIFAVLFGGKRAPANAMLGWINIGPIGFLTDPAWALPTLLLAAVWIGVGFTAIFLLAALRNVDATLLDAAALDGAGATRRLWHVILPGIRPALLLLVVASSVWGLQLFELPFLLFNGPGPGYRGLTVVMYLYRVGFEDGQLGYASTIGWVLLVLCGSLALVQIRLLREQP